MRRIDPDDEMFEIDYFRGSNDESSMKEITQILNSCSDKDPKAAAEELLPLVYEQLRKLAASRMAGERPGQTLQATALVHEAWLKVRRGNQQTWKNRTHFFAAVAEAMRRILIDRARKRQVRERAGYAEKEELKDSQLCLSAPTDEILAVHEALDQLEQESAEAALLVKLRYFTGMTMPECAEAMDLPLRNVERIWTFARSWLRDELDSQSA
jgi:RNA polymerase sigma factor (TIGR02999 family)